MSNDDLKQKMSAWMDDELSDDSLYSKLIKDEDCQKSWESYHAISAALKHETSENWESGFSDRVAAVIQNEPAILAPSAWQRTKSSFAGWAVAASVALIAVVGTQFLPMNIQTNNGPSLAINEEAPQDKMLAEYHITEQERAELDRINMIFSKFEEQSGVKGDNSLPYVRVVSGETVKTFRMSPQQFRKVMMELERRKELEKNAKDFKD